MIPSERIEPLAPGCFGFAITFNSKSPECSGCDYARKCQPIAYASLEKASADINVSDLSKDHAVFGCDIIHGGAERIGGKLTSKLALTYAQNAIVKSLTPRAAGIAKGIYKKLGDPLADMRKGANPFIDIKPYYLSPLAQVLANGGTLTRLRWTEKLAEQNQQWTPKTTATRASMAWGLFVKMGIAIETNGVLKLA